jgi:hypothetical protein
LASRSAGFFANFLTFSLIILHSSAAGKEVIFLLVQFCFFDGRVSRSSTVPKLLLLPAKGQVPCAKYQVPSSQYPKAASSLLLQLWGATRHLFTSLELSKQENRAHSCLVECGVHELRHFVAKIIRYFALYRRRKV